MTSQLNWMSAQEMAKGFAARKFSPLEVAKACLAQISGQESRLNAMSFMQEETTLAQAMAATQRWAKGKQRGPLDGVPVLIKEIVMSKVWPNRRGSKIIDPKGPWEIDAPCVARLREAGCVFLGLTTTPEFGWKGVTDSPLTGVTRNPWNTDMTPGGSSGGSSAALAAGYGPLAIGTDGGGSIRIPASFTGTFGLKPSFGRVPAWPLSPFGTVAHVGPMARTVADAALMLDEISKPDNRDWHALPYDGGSYGRSLRQGIRGMRIAYSRNLGYVDVDPEVAALVEQAVRVLKRLGAKVTVVDPGFEDPVFAFKTIWWSGAHFVLGALPPDKLALLEPALAEVVEQARGMSANELLEANRQRGMLGTKMRLFMENFDVLVTPTMPIPAFEAGQLQPSSPESSGKWVNWTPFTYPFNLTQQPAASVPCGFTKMGLPAGLQVVGRMFDDRTVLRVCAAYESETQFGRAKPSMPIL
jgi:aspartyl-tRNA(Asn)/glutamyl-tRNA(Gln) amidotransferase subunit A